MAEGGLEDNPNQFGIYIYENPKVYNRPRTVADDEEVWINEQLGRRVKVGISISPELREKLIDILRKDVAYSASDMPRAQH